MSRPILRAVRAAALIAAFAAAIPYLPAGAAEPVIYGGNGAGCIAGAVELPPDGPGFQEIRFSRSVFWGHPRTIALVEQLGARARAAGLPDIYVNDISSRYGGPSAAHAGHEIGMEVDIWLDVRPKPRLSAEQRDALEVPSVVRRDGRGVDPAIWRPEHVRLLQLAATLPDIERIFVNPAIKRELCNSVTGDRAWLHLIRPWHGHASHFHIRFRCPAGQAACVEPPPPPGGDGCDASLQWWFDQLDNPAAAGPPTPRPPPVLPAACRAVLAGERP